MNSLRKYVGIAAVVAASIAAPGCARFGLVTNGLVDQFNSTRYQQAVVKAGRMAEKVKDSNDKFVYDEDTRALHIWAPAYFLDGPQKEKIQEQLGALVLKDNPIIGFIEGDALRIEYADGRVQQQMVTNNGFIGTYFGTVRALDENTATLEKLLEEKGKMDVTITQITPSEFYSSNPVIIGKVPVNGSSTDGEKRSDFLDMPKRLSWVCGVTGLGEDADYIQVVVPDGNGKSTEDKGFDYVVLYSDAQMAAMGIPGHDYPAGHKWTVTFLANNPYRNFRRSVGEVGGLGNDLFGITDAARGIDENMHYFKNRGMYLPQNESPLQRAERVTGEVSGTTGNIRGTIDHADAIKARITQPPAEQK